MPKQNIMPISSNATTEERKDNMNTEKTDDIALMKEYAALDFDAEITGEQASRLGGKILSDHMVGMRIAFVVLSKTKKELVEGIGSDSELLITTLEGLQDLEKALKGMSEFAENAVIRLLSVASTLEQQGMLRAPSIAA